MTLFNFCLACSVLFATQSFSALLDDQQVATKNLIIQGQSKLLIIADDKKETPEQQEVEQDGKRPVKAVAVAVTDGETTTNVDVIPFGPSEIVITGSAADVLFAKYFSQKGPEITRSNSLTVNGRKIALSMIVAKSQGLTCVQPDDSIKSVVKMVEQNPESGNFREIAEMLKDSTLKDYFYTRCSIQIDRAGNVILN